MHIGEPEVAAAVAIGETLVVEAALESRLQPVFFALSGRTG
jgi:hypothetical protein